MKKRILNSVLVFMTLLALTFSAMGATSVAAKPLLSLGTYPVTSVVLGGNATVTPDVAPVGVTSLNVSANTNFKGTFIADPATGVVRVINAHPAGTYTVTVKAFGSSPATTTFTLTVTSGVTCVATPDFSSAANVSVGTNPNSMAIGDFNNDGKQDFAVGNQGSGTVSIRLGDGAGGFSGATNVSVGGNPRSVAIGDFNGDGNQDLAAAYGSSISIRLGDGIGGLSGTTEISAGVQPWSVAIGDFNGDGKQDLAATDNTSASVLIRLGDGSGGFSGTTSISVQANPQHVAIGDFNNDNKQDLAVANYSSHTISIRLGDGAGNFSGTTNVSVGNNPGFVAIGDFNHDGNQDFASANVGGSSFSIRLGSGAGGFSGTTTISAGAINPQSVAIGDFNNDGNQDLVGSVNGSASVLIRLGDGVGGFSGTTNLSVSTPRSVVVGDFNNDGKQDFATPNYSSSTISVRLGNLPLCYDGNGNTSGAVPATAIYAPSSSVNVSDNTGILVKTGYIFNGWNTAADGSGASYLPAANFNIAAPTILYAQWYKVTTNAATSITVGDATLNGVIIKPNNLNTTVAFEYGLDTSYGTTVTAAESPLNGSSDTAVSYALSALAVNTQYHYRVVATNSLGTTYGDDATFWTLANPPSGATLSNATASTLDITFNVNGNPATTEFAMYELRLNKYIQADGSLGDTAVWQTAAAWGLPKMVTGLNVATVYAFNVKARNGAGVETSVTASNTLYTMGTCSSSAVTVTSTADTGAGTLRQALADICAGGTITFDAALSGQTILLDSGFPVAKSMTIDGSALAAQITLDGNNITRPFRIYAGPIHVNSLTFMHGYISGTSSGGAIWNQSGNTLTVANSVFYSNTGLSNNGGAILNNGTLTVVNSTFANNTAVHNGGAIYNAGTLTIINSTFSGNSAASGGAIYNNSGTVNFTNNILANSTGGDCVISAGTIGTNVNNLVEDGSCSATYSGDPLLSALGNYGGSSQTLALLPGSSAVNVGNTAACADGATVNSKDQRGVTRPAACDIGAFESQGFTFGSLTGTPQGTAFNTAFASSLGLTVTPNGLGEPVSGGQVLFTSPVSGASAIITGSPATIDADGKASVSATANNTIGAYNVTASAIGATNSPTFALTNLATYAVTYNANGADSGSVPSSQTKTQTVDLTLATNSGNLARNGYTFAGWNTQADGLGTHYATGGTYTANGAVYLYAEWTVNSYTVTFDGNSGDTPSPISKSATFGSPYGTLATVSRTGYSFNGWYTAASGGSLVTSSTSVSSASNHTLYAHWTINSYTVTFKNYDGSTIDTQNIAYGSGATAPANPSKPATAQYTYTFTGWDVAFNNVTDNLTVTATYSQTVNIYTVTFKNYDGNTIETQNIAYGSGATAPANPSKPATAQYTYTFTGWDVAFNNITDNLTVTATYSQTVNGYTVTFNSNGGSGSMSDQSSSYNVAANLTLNTFTQTGYTFAGWNTALDGSGTPYADGASYPFASSTTLYAQWSDSAAPSITTFTATSPSNSLSIPIATFSATDNVGVTGYMITESPTSPAVGDSGWNASIPTTYTVLSGGTYLLYPWAKDAAGNISAASTPVSVIIDLLTPTISITAHPDATTTSTSASFAFSGTDLVASSVASYQCKLDSDSFDVCTSPKDYSALVVGTHTFQVKSTDNAGNESLPASFTWMIQKEYVTNGGFNTYTGVSKIPANWKATNFSATDGKDASTKKEGSASVKIIGQAGKVKTLTQSITLSGTAGNPLTLSYWVKTSKVSSTGKCQIQILFYSGKTSKGAKTLACPTGATYKWKQVNLNFNAPAAYTSLKVVITFSKTSGNIWFDAVSLKK